MKPLYKSIKMKGPLEKSRGVSDVVSCRRSSLGVDAVFWPVATSASR